MPNVSWEFGQLSCVRFDSDCATLTEIVKGSLGKFYCFTNLNAHADTHLQVYISIYFIDHPFASMQIEDGCPVGEACI